MISNLSLIPTSESLTLLSAISWFTNHIFAASPKSTITGGEVSHPDTAKKQIPRTRHQDDWGHHQLLWHSQSGQTGCEGCQVGGRKDREAVQSAWDREEKEDEEDEPESAAWACRYLSRWMILICHRGAFNVFDNYLNAKCRLSFSSSTIMLGCVLKNSRVMKNVEEGLKAKKSADWLK